MRECPGIPRESESGVESTRNRGRSRVRHCAQEGDARLQSVWSVWSVSCKRATGSRACGDVVAAPIGWGASVVTSEVRDARFGGLVVLRWSSGMSALRFSWLRGSRDAAAAQRACRAQTGLAGPQAPTARCPERATRRVPHLTSHLPCHASLLEEFLRKILGVGQKEKKELKKDAARKNYPGE